MTQVIDILPMQGPIRGIVRPPGSKSITNRALILAALADGVTTLTGILDSHDTRVMVESLRRLGFDLQQDISRDRCVVSGRGGDIPARAAELWLENSGTSIRFLTSLCALGHGAFRLDGSERMRQRPIGDLIRALRQLGTDVHCQSESGECPPVVIHGAAGRLTGGTAAVPGSISSQFLSSLLMAGPACSRGMQLNVLGDLVSVPYVTMTVQMMRAFGATVDCTEDLRRFSIEPRPYVSRTYEIEPDASAASYFFAAAAITGGSVTVTGLSRGALQGDAGFVDALVQMGCIADWQPDRVTITGRTLQGIELDMNAISDTAQTLAAVAVFASSPTTIRNVAHMRHKETDRISAVVAELHRAGIQAQELTDGFRILPGSPGPAEILTYDDHRMAMSFSLLGLRAPGIRILDPGCTAKTYPNFFRDLAVLCGQPIVRDVS